MKYMLVLMAFLALNASVLPSKKANSQNIYEKYIYNQFINLKEFDINQIINTEESLFPSDYDVMIVNYSISTPILGSFVRKIISIIRKKGSEMGSLDVSISLASSHLLPPDDYKADGGNRGLDFYRFDNYFDAYLHPHANVAMIVRGDISEESFVREFAGKINLETLKKIGKAYELAH